MRLYQSLFPFFFLNNCQRWKVVLCNMFPISIAAILWSVGRRICHLTTNQTQPNVSFLYLVWIRKSASRIWALHVWYISDSDDYFFAAAVPLSLFAAQKVRAANFKGSSRSVFVHGGGNSSIEKTFALIFLLFCRRRRRHCAHTGVYVFASAGLIGWTAATRLLLPLPAKSANWVAGVQSKNAFATQKEARLTFASINARKLKNI